MAGRINDDDVKAVRDAVPIDSVVSEYLQLRNAGGGNLKGLCPFHDEKSPSFQVSPSKGLFHCFGCQEGGDTIAFVMKIDHLTFSETVERLAAQAGITLRYEEGGYNPSHQRGERIRLIEAHKVAAQFYIDQLENGAEAETGRAFLAERGFDRAAAEHFGVGYSPQGWDHLTRFLRGKGFSDKELTLSGLAQEGRRGPIDRFRGRLMWPIRDIAGDVVGFGARKLYETDNGPKYLNTPETAIYKKSQVLYGIDLAKKEIAKTSSAVVVEGYTDVMACHLAGVTTAIATCGTAFGGDHIKILRRLLMDHATAEVIFTFDGDAAGQKAALRAFEDDQKFAAETSIAITPGGMDPCELRLAEGDEAVRSLVGSRTPLFEFALRQLVKRHNLETPAGRAAALDEAAPIVAGIKNVAIQHESAVQLAGMVGILDTQFVVKRVAQLARWARDRGGRGPAGGPVRGGGSGGDRRGPVPGSDAGAPPAGLPAGPALNLRSPAHRTERELLKLALQRPELVSPAFDAYGSDEFTAPPYAAVRQTIAEAGGADQGTADAAGYLVRVRDAAPDDTVRSLVTELAVEAIHCRTIDETYAGVQLVQVRLRAVDRRIAEVQGTLARLGQTADPAQYTAVQNELWVLQQYAQSLRNHGAAAL
ncbi:MULTISPECIES: DNA primase [Streptomyces]|uniref:DNA primase n=1 Tax=Streptomyces tsukubensis (strain DSM 42081 / NBRC 108919 / NRRL 18488 / 9993) TaxID=1114943 RepID=I2MXX1_STRT9|nr:DNA primase [Streptomyces tsukubensis]MYS66078.1 DNA primase [Streptomyces sp. SID5473]AZK93971.1 DNA primase [Streptomyces tsukubensis]EIF89618.1 DNA primase [Streptomyces tsukubensis NRRL18488]QKM69910.1 DNA primase [Streptomyces tsukubensis NRRL18488]TAI46114.1 DNA primase [Streptomyces tsukubensis]